MKSVRRSTVAAAVEGGTGRAGALLLYELADRTGLTPALSAASGGAFTQVRAHDPGALIGDLAVTLADGGNYLSDRAALGGQPDLFGAVASDASAWRAVDRLEQVGLAALDRTRAVACAAVGVAGRHRRGSRSTSTARSSAPTRRRSRRCRRTSGPSGCTRCAAALTRPTSCSPPSCGSA
jgi:hypothetical protein